MGINHYLELLRPRDLAMRVQRCPLCGFPLLLRLSRQEHGIRCPGCRAGPAHMSLGACIRAVYPDLAQLAVYEMSSRGPLCRMLRRESVQLQLSEYFEDLPTGQELEGVRCENVECLSFEDQQFDLCTSTEVFEHVVDDRAGFREVLRVLKPGGRTIFTVPLDLHRPTVERAKLVEGRVQHILPPEYHGDRLRGQQQVLAFRTYGTDIVDRMMDAGFADATIDTSCCKRFFGYGRAVVMARKTMTAS